MGAVKELKSHWAITEEAADTWEHDAIPRLTATIAVLKRRLRIILILI
jgi:hypothetical protein